MYSREQSRSNLPHYRVHDAIKYKKALKNTNKQVALYTKIRPQTHTCDVLLYPALGLWITATWHIHVIYHMSRRQWPDWHTTVAILLMSFAQTDAHRSVRRGRSRRFYQAVLGEILALSAVKSTHARTVLIVGNTVNSKHRSGTPWSQCVLWRQWTVSTVNVACMVFPKIKELRYCLMRIGMCPPIQKVRRRKPFLRSWVWERPDCCAGKTQAGRTVRTDCALHTTCIDNAQNVTTLSLWLHTMVGYFLESCSREGVCFFNYETVRWTIFSVFTWQPVTFPPSHGMYSTVRHFLFAIRAVWYLVSGIRFWDSPGPNSPFTSLGWHLDLETLKFNGKMPRQIIQLLRIFQSAPLPVWSECDTGAVRMWHTCMTHDRRKKKEKQLKKEKINVRFFFKNNWKKRPRVNCSSHCVVHISESIFT